MDPIFIYIHLDDYLAQWFINDQGGKYPVELKRGSVESIILESFLAKQPEDIPQQTEANNPDAVKIAIPFFKSKDVNYFNYLPKRAEDLLVTSIINRQDELIYAFMESHGIEINEKNWCTIAKRYQRKRTVYRINERVKKFRSNLKAKKR